MNTRALRTLLRIHATGSFAEAARQLNMTLSAVSMQMKTLEESLGLALFDRSFRPPQLTPLARDLLPRAQTMLEAEAAFMATATPQGALTGRYEIGFVATASVRILPGFLARAKVAHPGLGFTLSTGLSQDLEARVESGALDAAVLTDPDQRRPRLAYLRVGTEPLHFAVPRSARSRDPAILAALMPFLQFTPDSGIGQVIARARAGFTPKGAPPPIQLDNVDAILECVKLGLGFTLLPAPDIHRYGDPQVVEFASGDAALSRNLSLCLRDAASPAARAIHSLLLGGSSDQG